jgi:hypothetical protein
MSPGESKMQPTIQQEEEPDIYRLHVQCIVDDTLHNQLGYKKHAE